MWYPYVCFERSLKLEAEHRKNSRNRSPNLATGPKQGRRWIQHSRNMGTPCGHRWLAVSWVGWPLVGAVGCQLGRFGAGWGGLASVGPPTDPQMTPTDTQPARGSEVSRPLKPLAVPAGSNVGGPLARLLRPSVPAGASLPGIQTPNRRATSAVNTALFLPPIGC